MKFTLYYLRLIQSPKIRKWKRFSWQSWNMRVKCLRIVCRIVEKAGSIILNNKSHLTGAHIEWQTMVVINNLTGDRKWFKQRCFGGNLIHWVVSYLEKKLSEALISLESFFRVQSSHINISRTINCKINLAAFYKDIMCEWCHILWGIQFSANIMSNTQYLVLKNQG